MLRDGRQGSTAGRKASMTLFEALQDIGKGRIADVHGTYELIALARGVYTFHFWETGEDLVITLSETPAENAIAIKKQFSAYCRQNHVEHVTRSSYHK